MCVVCAYKGGLHKSIGSDDQVFGLKSHRRYFRFSEFPVR